MKHLADILLAEDDLSGLVELLVIVVLVIIGAIVSAVQKVRKEKESQETADRWRREREQKNREERQVQGGQEAPSILDRMEQQARQNLGLSSSPPPPVRRIAAPPPRLESAAPVQLQPVQDAGEVAHNRQRAKLLKQRQEVKLFREADVASRHLKEGVASQRAARPAALAVAEEAADQPAAVEINLGDLSEAQRAIIHLEILSPPKALRQGAEQWDA